MHGAKRERIIRVLLNNPEGSLSKYRVAKLTGCSIGWTMEYLKKLEEMGLVKGTHVVRPAELLDYWYSITGKPLYYDFFLQSPESFLQSIDLEYVLTTYKAENLLNHYLFPTRIDLYVHSEDLHGWKERIIKEGLVGKGNFRLLIYDDHVFYRKKEIDGLYVASVPQVLIDLRREGGVCQEAYEMMVKRYVRTE